jgi:hypothetical protein
LRPQPSALSTRRSEANAAVVPTDQIITRLRLPAQASLFAAARCDRAIHVDERAGLPRFSRAGQNARPSEVLRVSAV